MKSCQGILVTSVEKDDWSVKNSHVEKNIPTLLKDYDNYKINTKFPTELKGGLVFFLYHLLIKEFGKFSMI